MRKKKQAASPGGAYFAARCCCGWVSMSMGADAVMPVVCARCRKSSGLSMGVYVIPAVGKK